MLNKAQALMSQGSIQSALAIAGLVTDDKPSSEFGDGSMISRHGQMFVSPGQRYNTLFRCPWHSTVVLSSVCLYNSAQLYPVHDLQATEGTLPKVCHNWDFVNS